MSQPWTFEWFTTWNDVWRPAVIDRWQTLLDDAGDPHVFATPSLVRAWWLATKHDHKIEPRFLLATSTDGATVFIPFIIVKHGVKNACLRTFEPAGYAVYDYHDPITHGMPEDRWPHFWESFAFEMNKCWRGTFDRAVLGGLRICPALEGAEVSDRAPYIPLAGISTADDFLASLGKSLRGDIRRQLRRMEEVGSVSFRVLQPDEIETALTWLPDILAQHTEKWPKSYKLPGFHAALIQEALPAGLLHLSELKVDDIVVSRHLGFFYGRRFYWYMPVYNAAFQIYSPGKLHLYFCAVDAIGKGGEIFDLLRGDEDYKRQWTENFSELFEVSWRGSSSSSLLRLTLAESVKPALQKLRSRL